MSVGEQSVSLVGIPKAQHEPSLAQRIYTYRYAYLAIAPTFFFLIVFKYYPMFSALYHSLFEWDGYLTERFIGAENFIALLEDDIFLQSLHNMLILATAHVAVQIVMPLIGAELIFNLRNPRLRYFWRVLFVIPLVAPNIVVLLIWGYIYTPQLGLLNQTLRAIGLEAFTHSWLGDPGLALWSIIFVNFPWVGGVALLIYLAGLQNVSDETLDAARLDGATGLRRLWYIDLPLITGQLKVISILALIQNIRGFGEVLILTDGGPGYATMVPGLHMYQSAFIFGRMGYACAIGTLLFALILLVTWINLRFVRSPLEVSEQA